MKIQLSHHFEDIISVENLLSAWNEFIRGKRSKPDVQMFEQKLMDNIFELHNELKTKTYRHGGYKDFYVCDPKPRHIHKARVRDRLIHHAIYRLLYPFFDRTFMTDSFSCRINKGTHKAIQRFQKMCYVVSQNNTKTCWVLKCDIKKCFASIDQNILVTILRRYIPDSHILWLLQEIISSFNSGTTGVGLPLGNLTSQLFINIYMNEFDQFVKHKLKTRHYMRYADDFVILSQDRKVLQRILGKIQKFTQESLRLNLHPHKLFIKTFASGIDFLGWVNFPGYMVLRTATKRRIFRRIKEHPTEATLQSYLGLLRHGNAHSLENEVVQYYWLWRNN